MTIYHAKSVCLLKEAFQKKKKRMTYELEHKELFLLPKAATRHFRCHPLCGVFLPSVSQYTDVVGTHQENKICGKIENFFRNKQIQIFKSSGLELKHSSFCH